MLKRPKEGLYEAKAHLFSFLQFTAKKAEAEYEAFNKTQKITSDFDKEVKKMLENGDERIGNIDIG